MPFVSLRSTLSTWLMIVPLALLVVPLATAAPAPSLLGTFGGTYMLTGQTTAETFEMEVERQHGRRLRVSIFATDQPEFQGRAKLMRDNVTLTLHTRATGRGAARLSGTGAVGDGGATISGTFLIHQRGVADRAGTFSVVR